VEDVHIQQLPFSSSNLLLLLSQGCLKLKESICVDGQWRIECCPPKSTIQCFKLQKTMAFKCEACTNLYKLVNGIFAPCYLGFLVEYHNESLKHHKHLFFLDDLSHCVGGTTQKFAIAKLTVPIVWPIQKGTNLTQKKATILEKAWFSFDCLHRNNVQSLFGFQSSSSSNSHVPTMSCHNLVKSSDANCWPITNGGKKVRRPFVFKITQQHTNNWEVGRLFLPMHCFPCC